MARSSVTSRNKNWVGQEVCADCGATDPGWASLNRGILICDECCSVHRSLGRHISHVKSLKKGHWHSSLLSMIHSLSSSGANNIWEHTLLDPSVSKGHRRKPNGKDDVHPVKADFIRAKYQMLSFVHRPVRDDSPTSDGDVSRQLHSSVRTGNLETSLRLLSQGADPNFFHPEKGTCPLHVATKANQVAQVELLVIYGADPGVIDSAGLTPIDYARESGQIEASLRLIDLQYELTDTLSFYLCGSKPDHSVGQHWLIPDGPEKFDMSDVSREARFKLIMLSNLLFEELVSDVYDEVDRRQTDVIWLSMQSQSALLSDRCSVPFLPLNPDYSSTRNQGRQKLARLSDKEFRTLVKDVLVEAQRRSTKGENSLTRKDVTDFCFANNNGHGLARCVANNKNTCSASCTAYSTSLIIYPHTTPLTPGALNDEEPLYDSVASEDDYSSLERHLKITNQLELLNKQKKPLNSLQEDYQEVVDCDNSQAPIAPAVSIDQYLEMKRQLEVTEAKVRDLQDNNVHMKAKLQELSSTVVNLREENDCLRIQQSPSRSFEQKDVPYIPPPSPSQKLPLYQSPYMNYNSSYVTNSHTHSLHNGDGMLAGTSGSPLFSPGSDSRPQRPYSMFEIRGQPSSVPDSMSSSFHDSVGAHRCSQEDSPDSSVLIPKMPTQDCVVMKTEVITRRIQDLLRSAQEAQYVHFIPCSQQINVAVRDMAELFPKTGCPIELSQALRQLVVSANRLHSECRSHVGSQMHTLDPDLVSQQVIQCAYDIAKAAKSVVTLFQ